MRFRKEWQKIAVITGIACLFILIILTIFNFRITPEDIVIEPEQNNQEDINYFTNKSDMEENDIRLLMEQKRETFKSFLSNVSYYKISEVGEGYTKEDDESYIALTEEFLEEFRSYVIEDFYTIYWNQLEEVVKKKDINLQTRIYLTPIEIFDTLYSYSAIASNHVTEEQLILINATNEKIEAKENIKYCKEEDPEYCTRDDKYDFILEKENDTWKIAKLY